MDILQQTPPFTLQRGDAVILHRIAAPLRYYKYGDLPSGKAYHKEKNEVDVFLDPPQTAHSPATPLPSHVKTTSNGWLDPNHPTKKGGISHFILLSEDQSAWQYAHQFIRSITVGGTTCFVCSPFDYQGTGLICDRILKRGGVPYAMHVLRYPTSQISFFELNEIALCQAPPNEWRPCQIRGGAEEIDFPEVDDPDVDSAIYLLHVIASSDRLTFETRFEAALYAYLLAKEEKRLAGNIPAIVNFDEKRVAELFEIGFSLERSPAKVVTEDSLIQLQEEVEKVLGTKTIVEELETTKEIKKDQGLNPSSTVPPSSVPKNEKNSPQVDDLTTHLSDLNLKSPLLWANLYQINSSCAGQARLMFQKQFGIPVMACPSCSVAIIYERDKPIEESLTFEGKEYECTGTAEVKDLLDDDDAADESPREDIKKAFKNHEKGTEIIPLDFSELTNSKKGPKKIQGVRFVSCHTGELITLERAGQCVAAVKDKTTRKQRRCKNKSKRQHPNGEVRCYLHVDDSRYPKF